MDRLTRLLRRLHLRLAHAARPRLAPELWCRPATVLVLRDPAWRAACLGGWR